MKTIRLFFTFIINVCIIFYTNAQVGNVLSYSKISSLYGNFNGILKTDDSFGRASSLGDFDKDGIDDIVVAATFDDDGGTNRGAVWLLMLNDDYTVKTHYKISSTSGNFGSGLDDNDAFGSSVCGLSDLNNDGVNDIAVGAWGDDDGGLSTGAFYILFLNSNGTVKSKQKISAIEGNFTGSIEAADMFGIEVSNLGDLDNDGVIDLGVTAREDDDGGSDRGALWILYLNTNGTVKAHSKISNTQGGFTGELSDGDWFGRNVTRIKDLDGDNIDELVVGATNDDDLASNSGAIWVLFMNSDETVKKYQKINNSNGNFTGTLDANDCFGIYINYIGDINKDGISDIAVSAYSDDDVDINSGAIWIICLNNDGTVKTNQKISQIEGNFTGDLDAYDNFGATVNLYKITENTTTLLVSACNDSDGATEAGAVWILTLGNLFKDLIITKDTAMCSGETIMLKATKKDTYSYLWSNAEISSSISVSPTETTKYYLTITEGTNTYVDSVTVFVNQNPQVSISGTLEICETETTKLTALGGDVGATYIWSNSKTSKEIEVSIGGNYSVTITNSTTCKGSTSILIVVNEKPTIELGENISECSGNTVVLDAGTGFTYKWQNNSTNQTFSVTETGKYFVTITNQYNCSTTDSVFVTFNSFLDISISGKLDICQTDTTILTAIGGNIGATYIWSNGKTSNQIEVSTAGNYSVTVSNSTTCSGNANVNVTVNLRPSINFGDDFSQCEGNFTLDAGAGFTYKWQDNSDKQTFLVTQTGNYSVTVTSTENCSNSDEIFITINQNPQILITGELEFCQTKTTILTASGGDFGATYIWSNGKTSNEIEVSTAGNYSITVTNSTTCKSDTSINITEKPNPTVNLGIDITKCENEEIPLLDAGNYDCTFLWSDGTTQQTNKVENIGTNNISVTVTSALGCKTSDTIIVTINPLPNNPTGEINMPFYQGVDEEVILDAYNGDSDMSYFWTETNETTSSISISTDEITNITYYNVKIQNTNTDCFKEINFKIIPIIPKIEPYNVITPNGDGNNDTWKIKNIEYFPKAIVSIYNRNGDVIMKPTTNYSEQIEFKGENNYGVRVPAGVYFYIIDMSEYVSDSFKGTLSVVRE